MKIFLCGAIQSACSCASFSRRSSALGDEPVLVSRERGQFDHERRVVFDQLPNAVGIRNAPPIAATEQHTDLTRTRGLHIVGHPAASVAAASLG
jgi:hypothetical protein